MQGQGTIQNDDSATLAIDDVAGDEDTGDLVFTVTLTGSTNSGFTVDFTTVDGSAEDENGDGDYQSASGTLTFAGSAGETETVTVTMSSDTTVEPDETFVVDLSNIQGSGGVPTFSEMQGQGTIQNDDSATLAIDDVAMPEGDSGTTTFSFTVTLSEAVDGGFDVDFATADDSAEDENGDGDYQSATGTLTFAGTAGETQSIDVDANGDLVFEGDESFLVDLSNLQAVGLDVTITDSQGVGTLIEDELDFGDAPDPLGGTPGAYPTLLANDGARHAGGGAAFELGTLWDAEADGQQSAGANGDDLTAIDDEDGVTIPAALFVGQLHSVTVTGTVSGRLNAWIDFGQDGSWLQPGDQIATDVVTTGVAQTVSFTVPPGAAAGSTFARFRLDSGGGLAPTGLAADGEVEDYRVMIDPSADLSVAKVGPTMVNAGSAFSYTIDVSNAGPSPATGVQVVDTLPPGVTFDGFSGSSWSCTNNMPGAGQVTCTLSGSLAVGSAPLLTLGVTAPNDAGTITNDVTAMAVENDPTTPNTDSVMTSVAAVADLSVTTSDSPDPVVAGAATGLTYTVKVTNAGPSAAENVVVTDTLAVEATLVSTTGCAEDPTGAPTCTLGTIPAGMSKDYMIKVTIDSAATGTITNQATAASSTDLVNPSPSDSELTSVIAEGDLVITKTDDLETATPGDPISYIIQIDNEGPSDVVGALVVDIFSPTLEPPDPPDPPPPVPPAEIPWVCFATPGSSCSNDEGTQVIIEEVSIAAGGFVLFIVDAKISETASGVPCELPGNLGKLCLINEASVDPPAGFTDTVPGNNESSDETVIAVTGDLSVAKTNGLDQVVPGEQVTYVVVVTNSSINNAEGATVSDIFPSALRSNPPQADDVIWSCIAAGSAPSDPGDPSSEPFFSACETTEGQDDLSETVDIAAGGTVTFIATATVRSDAIDLVGDDSCPAALGFDPLQRCLVNKATVDPPPGFIETNGANNSVEDADKLTAEGNLSIVKDDHQAIAVPGEQVIYTLTVSNAGPSDVVGATVNDMFPELLEDDVAWTCEPSAGSSCPVGNTGDIAASVSIPAGGAVTFTAVGTIKSSATGFLINTASVAPPTALPFAYNDVDPVDDSSVDTDGLDPMGDLRIAKENQLSDGTEAVPGAPITYEIAVSNDGPSDAVEATVTDVFPSELIDVSWECMPTAGSTCPAMGDGDIGHSVTVLAGGRVTFAVAATVRASATGTLVNTAAVAAPANFTDTDGNNDSAIDSVGLQPTGDLSVTKDDFRTVAVSGEPLTYTIAVENAGPSDAVDARITDIFPAELSEVSWSCSATAGSECPDPPAGSDDLDHLVTVLADGRLTFIVDAIVDAAAEGMLINTASVALPVDFTDTDPENDSATDTDELNPTGDLSITKDDGMETAVPGEPVTYTIVVSNSGPSDAIDAQVMDDFPDLADVIWTCIADSPDSICTSGGEGVIADSVILRAGDSVTYTATGTVQSSTSGLLVNTATVVPPEGFEDTEPSNDQATDTDTLSPTGDLTISKDDDQTAAVPGESVTYTLVASNSGPSDVTGATVIDDFPSELSGVTWICSASPDSSCPANGVGDIQESVDIAVGSEVTFLATGVIAPGATANLSNTASIVTPANFGDPDPDNNTDTDTDALLPEADLRLIKSVMPAGSVPPGITMFYTVEVANLGPSTATGVFVTDELPLEVTLVEATIIFSNRIFQDGFESGDTSVWGSPVFPTCSDSAGILTCDLETVASGTTALILIEVVVDPTATGTLINIAEVTTGIPDPDLTNNFDIVETIVEPGEADVGVSIEDDPDPVAVGATLTYTLTVTNAGPTAATGVTLVDNLPPEVSSPVVTPAAGCSIDLNVVTCELGTLGVGGETTVEIEVTVDPGAFPGLTNPASVSADQLDPDFSNNTDTENTTVTSGRGPADREAGAPGPAERARAGGKSVALLRLEELVAGSLAAPEECAR